MKHQKVVVNDHPPSDKMWGPLSIVLLLLSGCLAQLSLPADVELTLFSPMVGLSKEGVSTYLPL